MTGVIDGGWNYVWCAYGITWAGFIMYTCWLSWRLGKGR